MAAFILSKAIFLGRLQTCSCIFLRSWLQIDVRLPVQADCVRLSNVLLPSKRLIFKSRLLWTVSLSVLG